jgi:hypothetical protein
MEGGAKKCDDRMDKRMNGQQKSYIPQSFFGGGIQILSKINFRNLKKIYISCKSTFFPFDPFSYKKKTQITPPPFFKRLGYIGLLLSVHSFVHPVVTLFRLRHTFKFCSDRGIY